MRKTLLISILILLMPVIVSANIIAEWEELTSSPGWEARQEMGIAFYDGAVWLIGGGRSTTQYPDVWYTYNGVDWTQANDMPADAKADRHRAVVYGDYIYVFPMQTNSVYITNGVDWASLTLNAETTFTGEVIEWDNKLMSIQADGDVYTSADGISWSLTSTGAGWATSADRTGFRVLVNDGYIWLTGGQEGTLFADYKNDVWRSPDGVTWTKIVEEASWSARTEHAFLYFKNNYWVISGTVSGSASKETWRSTDGITWTQDKDLAGELRRMGYFVINDSAILFGGYYFVGIYSESVYQSAFDVPTITITPTITETHTITSTATITPTRTPIVTATPTYTRTITQTATPTATPTITRTNTPVYTPTVTMTVTPIYTPFLRYVSTDTDGHQTGTRLEWTKYNDVEVTYTLNLDDVYYGLSDELEFLNDDDESVYNYVFTKTLENLRCNGLYDASVEASIPAWGLSYISNVVSFMPCVSPTPIDTPTP